MGSESHACDVANSKDCRGPHFEQQYHARVADLSTSVNNINVTVFNPFWYTAGTQGIVTKASAQSCLRYTRDAWVVLQP